MTARSSFSLRTCALVLTLGGLGLWACDNDASEPASRIDTRLETHSLLPGAPSEQGLAYIEAAANAHREADAIRDPEARAERLLIPLEAQRPADDGIAELAELELIARAAESLLEAGQHARVRELLEARVASDRSLPIDRSSARCLIALGDAAAKDGDHALAMGSYARALEMLSLLMEEIES